MAVNESERPANKSGVTTGIIIAVVAVLGIIAAFAFGLVDIDQTKETMVPDIKVVGGQAPAFDVDTAKIDVGTKKTGITVPTVDVGTTKASIEVPTVDVDKAN